ncbi:GNAT family N-acetyltransferase [Muricauda sp. ANG21]|uniref:GNAT family N-acetyltransferase n=1 Tax=Allomuricauda sp. ANG21 TaxID=3042468 RepID=UPI00345516B2
MKNVCVELIDPIKNLEKVLYLLKLLNPEMTDSQIEKLLRQMSQLSNYRCFGLFQEQKLIGISSGWTTVRIYCGKQLELDNVIIDSRIQSKGFGKYFIDEIKRWAFTNEYQSIGLNTYVQNERSHKFYFNQNFKILGFHFEQKLHQDRI